jgi:hypothetical protein
LCAYCAARLGDTARELAAVFAGVLRGWLDDGHWDAMRMRNGQRGPTDLWCASHDYCDANMAMDAAWRMVLGRPADTASTADHALWGTAWNMADRYISTARS